MREADEAILSDVARLAAAVGETIDADSSEVGDSEAVVRTLPGERATVVATDIVPAAVALATRNAEAHGLGDRFDARVGSLFDPVAEGEAGGFDLVLSNPPYVSDVEWEKCPPNVRDHEPATALRGGRPAGRGRGRPAEARWLPPRRDAVRPGVGGEDPLRGARLRRRRGATRHGRP